MEMTGERFEVVLSSTEGKPVLLAGSLRVRMLSWAARGGCERALVDLENAPAAFRSGPTCPARRFGFTINLAAWSGGGMSRALHARKGLTRSRARWPVWLTAWQSVTRNWSRRAKVLEAPARRVGLKTKQVCWLLEKKNCCWSAA